MNIVVPKYVIIALGAIFSAYMLVLASSSLPIGTRPWQVIIAMVLYAAATIASLAISNRRYSGWVAIGSLIVALLLPVLVTAQLPENHETGSDYSTWHVGAVGVLMVITSARGYVTLAWIGVGMLAVHSVLWAGLDSLGSLGVIGSVLWVGVSHMLQRSLAKADRDVKAYLLAEREAAEWQTAQEAHLSERRFRLGQTGRMALPMLRHIVATRAQLTDGQKRECLYLEAGIRDEIRGRTLLDDAVREQVMAARRRGATVNLLDEGGLDELSERELARVHRVIATTMRASKADTIIVRTVSEDSETAVTMVGLIASGVNLLGHSDADTDDTEIDMWLEIPRYAETP
jgi:hypothetical protein